MTQKVISFGEILWDSLPQGMFLGGAPLNVAINLKRLNIQSSILSALGNDALGDEAFQQIADQGLPTGLIQRNSFATGLVEVDLDDKGVPQYQIHENRAWDHVVYTDQAKSETESCDYLVFGSLGFRGSESSKTFRKILTNCRCKKVFDVNFRAPYYNQSLIIELLEHTDILKVNDEEIEEIAIWLNMDTDFEKVISDLCDRYNIETVVLTMGEAGSMLYTGHRFYKSPRFDVIVQDTVGAGDAFLSGVLFGLIEGYEPDSLLEFANAMGAFVAGSEGATPALNTEKVKRKFGLE